MVKNHAHLLRFYIKPILVVSGEMIYCHGDICVGKNQHSTSCWQLTATPDQYDATYYPGSLYIYFIILHCRQKCYTGFGEIKWYRLDVKNL